MTRDIALTRLWGAVKNTRLGAIKVTAQRKEARTRNGAAVGERCDDVVTARRAPRKARTRAVRSSSPAFLLRAGAGDDRRAFWCRSPAEEV
jgi:hypothetical protein